jgi:ParB-like chromosome segregation protein Spo0J
MQAHPYSELFPCMSKDELKGLKESIDSHGLIEPITIYQGMILDGRNRELICRKVGRQLRTIEFQGTDEEALRFVIDKNIHRRHLDASQRAMIAVEMVKHYEALAKARQQAAGGDKKSQKAKAKSVTEKVSQAISTAPNGQAKRAPTAVELAAKDLGVNPRYVADAKKIANDDPEMAEDVKRGIYSLSDAKRRFETKPPRKPRPARRFDPDRRWQHTTFKLLTREHAHWPPQFRRPMLSLIRKWVDKQLQCYPEAMDPAQDIQGTAVTHGS